MKVLFYSPLAVLSYHYETDLELIRNHQEKGDDIYVVNCAGDLKPTGFFGCVGTLRCSYCKSKCSQAMNYLEIPINKRITVDLSPYTQNNDYNFKDVEELKKYEYKGMDIGMCVTSSLISYLREPYPDLSRNKKHINDAINSTQALYDYLEALLDKIQPDFIYLFNGRFSMYRPLLRIAQKRGINFLVHERSSSLAKYTVTENAFPHDLTAKKKSMDEIINAATEEDIIRIGGKWYDNRIQRNEDYWYSFLDKQKRGTLPTTWNTNKKNIAIFISSEDEFEGVQGWENPLFKNQEEALKFLSEAFKNKPDVHFYVRVHPNLAGIKNSQTQFLAEYTAPNVTMIAAVDAIDTYELIQKSDKALSFGSTVGIEAVYYGTPSILVGHAYFEDLGAVYIPKSKEDLVEMIESKLAPTSKLQAMKYSYWFQTEGVPFKRFKPTNLSSGLFEGHSLRGNIFLMYLSYFFFFFNQLGVVFSGGMSLQNLIGKIKNKLSA